MTKKDLICSFILLLAQKNESRKGRPRLFLIRSVSILLGKFNNLPAGRQGRFASPLNF